MFFIFFFFFHLTIVLCYDQADVFANKPFSAELMEVENQLSFMQEELDAQHEERVEVLLSVCLCSFGWNCCRCEKSWIIRSRSSQLFPRCAGYVQEYRARCASALFVVVIQELARAKRSVAEYEKEAMQALQPYG